MCWNVDDFILSHVDTKVNDKLIEKLWKKCDTIDEGSMKVIRRKKHTHLGMLFDFSSTGEVKISMLDCVMELIKEFPEVIIKGKETPAKCWLFKVREEEKQLLSQEKAEQFHAFVAKLLFLCKRARPENQ